MCAPHATACECRQTRARVLPGVGAQPPPPAHRRLCYSALSAIAPAHLGWLYCNDTPPHTMMDVERCTKRARLRHTVLHREFARGGQHVTLCVGHGVSGMLRQVHPRMVRFPWENCAHAAREARMEAHERVPAAVLVSVLLSTGGNLQRADFPRARITL